jgi:DnaK suppressor protein
VKVSATKVAAKKAAPVKVAAKKAPAKKAPAKTPAKKAVVAEKKPRARAPIGPYATDAKFLDEQRVILLSERTVYQEQAEVLKAEADSLAQEREPGDVQFDEESGEGGTVTVDRERDLALSAQALAAVEEIEDALVRVAKKTYGACERCHQPIMKARLRALPYARLCVACKSGGLSRR